MRATIFNIQRFSINDGPGIRTTVFFKGCNLNCKWCHNPESINKKPELLIYTEKCICCGNCVKACNYGAHIIDNGKIFIREKCIGCGECAKVCYYDAINMSGYEISSDELITELLKDKEFYNNSNGGVTFSGGEAMLQSDFLYDILKLCKDNSLHTTIDTAGNISYKNFKKIMDYCDLFLYDIKTYNSILHKENTGVDNKLIIENVLHLINDGNLVIIRIPIIPSINDNIQEIKSIISIFADIDIKPNVELLPYHSLGSSKQKGLGKNLEYHEYKTPSNEDMYSLVSMFQKDGFNVIYND